MFAPRDHARGLEYLLVKPALVDTLLGERLETDLVKEIRDERTARLLRSVDNTSFHELKRSRGVHDRA